MHSRLQKKKRLLITENWTSFPNSLIRSYMSQETIKIQKYDLPLFVYNQTFFNSGRFPDGQLCLQEDLPKEFLLTCNKLLCEFIGTKERVNIRKEFTSHRMGLVHQDGHPFITKEHNSLCWDGIKNSEQEQTVSGYTFTLHYLRDSNPPDLIGSLPIWCLASRSPDFYQILPIYYKILKTREKLLIFRILGDLSLWNTHIILTFFAKNVMVYYTVLTRL